MSRGKSRSMVSGASGMLGTALRQGLAGSGCEVLQLVRREVVGVGEVKWDPVAAKPFANTETIEGLDATVHLSGASVAAHRWTAAYKREMWASRVASTRALAETLAGLRQPPKTLLVASATGIYGDRGDLILDERSEAGSGFLADLCCEWEAATRPAVEAGIRVVNLRFGVVLGVGGGAWQDAAAVSVWAGRTARVRTAMDELDRLGGCCGCGFICDGDGGAGGSFESDCAGAGY